MKERFEAMFLLSGIAVTQMYEIKNRYWPDGSRYDNVRSPWFLAKTDLGLIVIGYRKRVLSIDWSDTKVKAIVITDNVTKDDYSVHAWTTVKAVEYLTNLQEVFGKKL